MVNGLLQIFNNILFIIGHHTCYILYPINQNKNKTKRKLKLTNLTDSFIPKTTILKFSKSNLKLKKKAIYKFILLNLDGSQIKKKKSNFILGHK